jgi:hypothetical protein
MEMLKPAVVELAELEFRSQMSFLSLKRKWGGNGP